MATQKKKVTKSHKTAAQTVKKKQLSSAKNNFWKVEFNVNSVFWLVIGLAVVATAILTYNTNLQTTAIYDSIDQLNSENEAITP